MADPIAVALLWVLIHALFDFLAPVGFTTLGLAGVAGGLSLALSLVYLHLRTTR